jgi:hypothetical protein
LAADLVLFEFGSRGGSGSLIHVRLRRPVSDLKLLQRPAAELEAGHHHLNRLAIADDVP